MRGREPREGVIMKHYKQILWQRIAIILLIALFTIGVVACKKQPTQPSASQTEVPEQPGGPGVTDPDVPIIDGGDNGNTGGDNNQTYQPVEIQNGILKTNYIYHLCSLGFGRT